MNSSLLDHLLRAGSRTFFHSIWQGLILSIIAGVIMVATVKSKPAIRYSLLCFFFFFFIAAVFTTFIIELYPGSFTGYALKNAARIGSTTDLFSIQTVTSEVELFFTRWSSWIVGTWLFILLFRSLRMVADISQVNRLKTQDLLSVESEWILRLRSLSNQIGIGKKIVLMESALVHVPVVMGHFKPLILVPVGILANLSPAHIEAVLLHELAHVKRHDYLVNLIQRSAELALFFNPGLLWVSSLMRIERENCCDELAIEHSNSKTQFVEALISFKEHAMHKPAHAMALFGSRNQLLGRMMRIIHNRNRGLSIYEFLFFIASVVVVLILASAKTENHSAYLSYPVNDSKLADSIKPVSSSSSGPELNLDTKALLKQNFATTPDQRQIVSMNPKPVKEYPAPAVAGVVVPSGIAETFAELPDIIETNDQIATSIVKSRQTVITVKDDEELTTETRSESYERRQIANQKKTGDQHSVRDESAKMQEQVLKDRVQAELDRQQASRDRLQAELDRAQAAKDRGRAEKDRAKAGIDRRQAEADRKQADRDRMRADEDRARAEADRNQQHDAN